MEYQRFLQAIKAELESIATDKWQVYTMKTEIGVRKCPDGLLIDYVFSDEELKDYKYAPGARQDLLKHNGELVQVNPSMEVDYDGTIIFNPGFEPQKE